MDKLTVIGVEDDLLVVEDGHGSRYAIEVAALPELPRRSTPSTPRKASPRAIQTALREGSTAEEVAADTGEDLAFVRRFEGPVVAEREHVLEQALQVAVASTELDPLATETTFGSALEGRLRDLGASDESWFAWREGAGAWVVRLRFRAQSVDHVATWAFEPRKGALDPRDAEATALSQQGDATSVLMPRLRAVDQERGEPVRASESRRDAEAPVQAASPSRSAPEPEDAREDRADAGDDGQRFDSGAFDLGERGPSRPVSPTPTLREAAQGQPAKVVEAAVTTARHAQAPNHTADLLEALRRRRGEREAALAAAESDAPVEQAPAAAAGGDALFETEVDGDAAGRVHHTSPLSNARGKRGSRASMPSWDEIVFGSRGDDEQQP